MAAVALKEDEGEERAKVGLDSQQIDAGSLIQEDSEILQERSSVESEKEMSVDIDADDLAECLQDADVDMAIEADMADAKKKKEEEENARIEEDKIKQRIEIERKRRQAVQESSDDVDCDGLID